MIWRALGVFAATAVADCAWSLYTLSITERSVILAGFWSVVIILLSGFTIVSYVRERVMLAPAALGAFIGTVAGIWIKGFGLAG